MAVANLGQLVAEAWEFCCVMGQPNRVTRKLYKGEEYVWLWDWRTGRAAWRKL